MTTSEFRQVFLPYCLMRQADGSYVVCNRRYKPVGITSTEWVDYAAHPTRVHFKRMTAAMAKSLDCQGRDSLERIYLYNDGCVPTDGAAAWKAYAERLGRLAAYQIEH